MTTLADLLRALAEGQVPGDIPADCEYREEITRLRDYIADLAHFTGAMAAGDLAATLQRRGSLAGALKGLHANLRHLTWQTQQVAAGDFKQRVEFLGEFSAAFNSMVEALAKARGDLISKNRQLVVAYRNLKAAEVQLLQQEKMASVGQLAAGIAHEINNPMGFISSNLNSFRQYMESLREYVRAAEKLAAGCPESERAALAALSRKLDVDFIFEDMPALIDESFAGAKRISNIVQTLKNFSHVDESEVQQASINECLDSTLGTAVASLGSRITIRRDYGELPLVNCRPRQLNQLFMNLLLNAAQAIADNGEIGITTSLDGDSVVVVITDDGCGIPQTIIGRIFEPFFTTRPVGKGTGLGLSMCYDIVNKHHGAIDVKSTVGTGTTVTIRLPVRTDTDIPATATGD